MDRGEEKRGGLAEMRLSKERLRGLQCLGFVAIDKYSPL